MSYKLPTKDIIRINIYLNTIPVKEINDNWFKDKKRTDYFKFPNNTAIQYIEDNCPEMKLYFIQDLRNIVFKFIRKKFNIDVFSINQKNLDLERGIYYVNSDNFLIIDYYQILNEKTGNLSNKYIKTTIFLESEPTPWLNNVTFELLKIKNDKKHYYNLKSFTETLEDIHETVEEYDEL